MAVRNTAARRIPGDPLAGVLRQTARLARRSTRSTPVAGPPGPPGDPGPPGPAAPGLTATAVATLMTDDEGVATWAFPAMDGAAYIVATATGDVPLVVTAQQVDATFATLYVWDMDGFPAPGVTLVAVAYGQPAPTTEALDWPKQP